MGQALRKTTSGPGLSQDVPFFHTPSNLSELQSCKSIISTDSPLFSYLNSARQNLSIELCRSLKIIFNGYLVN